MVPSLLRAYFSGLQKTPRTERGTVRKATVGSCMCAGVQRRDGHEAPESRIRRGMDQCYFNMLSALLTACPSDSKRRAEVAAGSFVRSFLSTQPVLVCKEFSQGLLPNSLRTERELSASGFQHCSAPD